MDLPVDINELEAKGISREVLLNKFDIQLRREFELCGILSWLEPYDMNNISSIHTALSRSLEKLELRGEELQQLLYRIDIPEQEFSKLPGGLGRSSKLAELCIRRVLQKVVLKLIYSK